MTLDAQVQNGMIVPLQSLPFAEGTWLRIEAEEIATPTATDKKPRVGGEWRGKVWIAPDFDELPPDIAKAFGME